MTDAMGHYVGGGRMHLSQGEIQKMKKNMRKVPGIQEKSEKYHEVEDKQAEEFINEQLTKTTTSVQTIPSNKSVAYQKQKWRQKAFLWMRNKIQNLYTLKQK